MTDTTSNPTIQRALISVSDKTGIVEFARALQAMGVEILSTGGTHRLLRESGVDAIEIADVTGFPEIMAGRVKTLHPTIHGGILGRRGIDDAVMREHGIDTIDLVAVNLYPFEATIAQPDCSLTTAIENIDIGGPTMLRAAAKNHAAVTVVVDAADYDRVLADMQAHQQAVTQAVRFDLAVKAFEHTAAYDGAIANYFGCLATGGSDAFPRTLNNQWCKQQELRYGENAHQRAALYLEQGNSEHTGSICSSQQWQGKALSYNNIADADTALECVKSFANPACVIVKHANPCGVAINTKSIGEAYELAYATDPESAFGGVIAFNRELDAMTAQIICERQFVEVIIAPSATFDAKAIIAEKPNIRLLTCGKWPAPEPAWDYKRVNGGLLVQERDIATVASADLHVVSKRQPTQKELDSLIFANIVAKFVKSNAIVYATNDRTIGVGAGQMSRVNSARIAADKASQAGLSVAGAVMASDAFFPFRDGIDAAATIGITAVIQPGGSMRDKEVIAAADEADIAMVFTGTRHFRH